MLCEWDNKIQAKIKVIDCKSDGCISTSTGMSRVKRLRVTSPLTSPPLWTLRHREFPVRKEMNLNKLEKLGVTCASPQYQCCCSFPGIKLVVFCSPRITSLTFLCPRWWRSAPRHDAAQINQSVNVNGSTGSVWTRREDAHKSTEVSRTWGPEDPLRPSPSSRWRPDLETWSPPGEDPGVDLFTNAIIKSPDFLTVTPSSRLPY